MNGSELNLTSLTAEIVSAYVAHNTLSREQLPAMISSVSEALNRAVVHQNEPPKAELEPAVPIKKSVTAAYLFCLEDGKTFKSLKRHLQVHHGMSADEYRKKWGLSHDYPMVAPAYAESRSQLAKTLGFGRHRETALGRPGLKRKGQDNGRDADAGRLDTHAQFAAAIVRLVKGRSTKPLTGKVAIAEAYSIAARKGLDVGTLKHFKDRLAEAAREGLIELERCDVADVLPKDMLHQSRLRLGRDERHLIVNEGL
jgi:predicted transcriptional regulator